ncbi:hypothetical protein ASPZODRAFT_908077 [Penicilliopsis zonata CBS 506.65]|uniref:Uncharacterized protein n=1 Tax=Penicilliopsis zonata CBS 506.65 TaxID=1073090 RepID=A0A1L9S959_9EURO|nr:hypothetical protein ASPZODRAFT_908077 [Penicilliopsis zonata CBS 506.65]OJJ43659.1 hypothetical protein ASPZODRAFT_908077 [Penicilliopsis zonata CBS 506.65]
MFCTVPINAIIISSRCIAIVQGRLLYLSCLYFIFVFHFDLSIPEMRDCFYRNLRRSFLSSLHFSVSFLQIQNTTILLRYVEIFHPSTHLRNFFEVVVMIETTTPMPWGWVSPRSFFSSSKAMINFLSLLLSTAWHLDLRQLRQPTVWHHEARRYRLATSVAMPEPPTQAVMS